MAVLHRALFTWFNLLIFLILLVLRLDHRIQWNWFIVFIPMWLYDNILLVYIAFHMILSCKNTHERAVSIRRTVWYMIAVLIKLSAQILVCLKLETLQWTLPAKAVLAPFWALFAAFSVDVFLNLVRYSRY
ncbi:transmembrane protein 60 [Trichogramma pretiosum]|uniref:Transmembrane protein 60 n=1 Tax=Trichogramma kaykai TaxID=54128 RepID=A0ABD2XN62_9HYME|nr:transmembrane protein 60 [Trichogramma pretiosum]